MRIEEIIDPTDGVLARIVYCGPEPGPVPEGLHYVSPPLEEIQLALMLRKAGTVIQSHLHPFYPRYTHTTCEVLIVRKGVVRIEFFNSSKETIGQRILTSGDVVTLVRGGHGLEVLNDAEIVEVRNGPYAGDQDKQRFTTGG